MANPSMSAIPLMPSAGVAVIYQELNLVPALTVSRKHFSGP